MRKKYYICGYSLLICLLFGSAFFFLPVSVDAKEVRQRVSFAISGGASKGAYEAGLNWAVLKVLRYEAQRENLTLKGKYRPFEAASMTGASAGSINALLSAMAWCAKPEEQGGNANNIIDNVFRNLWFAPDINNLLPNKADSSIYGDDDALLARKSLIEASAKLRTIWRSPIFRKHCRIPLGVTVTRVFPEYMKVGDIEVKNQRFTFPFEFRVKEDGTGGFFYDPQDYPLLLDYSMVLLPYDEGGEKYEISDKRIEEIVLTSAAFPVAFGRKLIKHCRIKASYEKTKDKVEPAEKIETGEEKGLSCPEGYELSEAIFADGGLFDNLPIGLARVLAEESKQSTANPLPVTYIYFDPNRLRYQQPEEKEFELCHGENPPPACEELDYNFASESSLLFGAMGTAQSYELYREITSDTWSNNLSELSYQIANLIEESGKIAMCSEHLPFFDQEMPCAETLRFAGRFLEISYDRLDAPITLPFSVNKLKALGLVRHCHKTQAEAGIEIEAECYIDFKIYREDLAKRLIKILDLMPDSNAILQRRVQSARLSIHNDRIIRVTSRGFPITGELLQSFAAFLDLKFREFDYYVGVYDAVIQVATVICGHHYSRQRQPAEFTACFNAIAKRLYTDLGILEDNSARYVFALLAKWEFESRQLLQFAYDPMPAVQQDMQVIFDGLLDTIAAQWQRLRGLAETSSQEVQFFNYLKSKGFVPTPAEDGSRPLLANIIDDPELWTHELTRRFTNRLVYLENEAERIYAEREPDPAKRPETHGGILGGTSFVLRAATYKYPDFDFAPSTSPNSWYWRYLIPYEVAFDLSGGDMLFVWQPTWSLSKEDLLGVRGAFAVAEGLIGDSSHDTRNNYFSIGMDYTRLIGSSVATSWGVTPTYYQSLRTPETGSKETFGGDFHIGFLENKVRLGLGVRDIENSSDTWFLLLGITDLPGMAYWFTR
jgi:predicted acylesterase/phospholipase RssA